MRFLQCLGDSYSPGRTSSRGLHSTEREKPNGITVIASRNSPHACGEPCNACMISPSFPERDVFTLRSGSGSIHGMLASPSRRCALFFFFCVNGHQPTAHTPSTQPVSPGVSEETHPSLVASLPSIMIIDVLVPRWGRK